MPNLICSNLVEGLAHVDDPLLHLGPGQGGGQEAAGGQQGRVGGREHFVTSHGGGQQGAGRCRPGCAACPGGGSGAPQQEPLPR